jgi:hypothetical protein
MSLPPFTIRNLKTAFTGCLAVSSLAISAPAFSQTVDVKDIQHLNCTQQEQQLICKIQSVGNSNPESLLDAKPAIAQRTYLLGSSFDQTLADFLLALALVGAPLAAIAAIFWFDQRSATLQEQVEALERIWSQTSQD